MKTLLRVAFLSLALGVVLSFNATVHAQETGNPPVDGMPVPPDGFYNFSENLNKTIRKAALEARCFVGLLCRDCRRKGGESRSHSKFVSKL
jgi:hypothetical protein